MLKRLHLKNFTVFADANFEFGPGVNVLVGTNGTGKTHVLKLGYVAELARFDLSRELTPSQLNTSFANQIAWTAKLYKLLPEVFLSEKSGMLVRWDTKEQLEIEAHFGDENSDVLTYKIHPKTKDPDQEASAGAKHTPSSAGEAFRPIFIPAKEILTLSWMLPASEQLVIPIEKNYLDLLNQLRLLSFRKPESTQAISLLTGILGGEVREEEGKYYLVDTEGRRTAINMVAEGLRKFGTLQKLLANGSFTRNTTLYWDEPEANLNPALLRKLAAILAELARQGFQIILATHSMSLLKEFHILSRQKDAKPLPIKYFGLNAGPGEATRIITSDNFEYLPDIVALEVELEQADALEEIFVREDQQRHADNR
ncbi:MAG TPA: AAA family ATPase [Hymenobacter sp.]|jgi:hypothetical protein